MKEIQKSKNKFNNIKAPIIIKNEYEKNEGENKDNDNLGKLKNKSEEKIYFDKIYLNLKNYGTIMIGDEEYSFDLAKEMIEIAYQNNTYNDLPKILCVVDKRMKEEDKKKANSNG